MKQLKSKDLSRDLSPWHIGSRTRTGRRAPHTRGNRDFAVVGCPRDPRDRQSAGILQANLIMPELCDFIDGLPEYAIIRPTGAGQIDTVGAIKGFIADGLFIGQPTEFIELLLHIAYEADDSKRELQLPCGGPITLRRRKCEEEAGSSFLLRPAKVPHQ